MRESMSEICWIRCLRLGQIPFFISSHVQVIIFEVAFIFKIFNCQSCLAMTYWTDYKIHSRNFSRLAVVLNSGNKKKAKKNPNKDVWKRMKLQYHCALFTCIVTKVTFYWFFIVASCKMIELRELLNTFTSKAYLFCIFNLLF